MSVFYILGSTSNTSTQAVDWHDVETAYSAASEYPAAPEDFSWYKISSTDAPSDGNGNSLIGDWFENLSATSGATRLSTQPSVEMSGLVYSEAEIKAIGQKAIDAMNVVWVTDMTTGRAKTSGLERWINTYRWIVGATACALAVIRSTDTYWTDTKKVLVGVQLVETLKDVVDWYHKHNQAIWTAYVTNYVGDSSDQVRAWWKLDVVMEVVIPYGNDKVSSTAWDGTGGTIDVMFGQNDLIEDL